MMPTLKKKYYLVSCKAPVLSLTYTTASLPLVTIYLVYPQEVVGKHETTSK